MVTAINDDLFSQKIVDDPYTYFSQIRADDPVHWNEKYELWLVSRYADLVWVARHPEVFSSEWWKRDPRSPYPEIDESDKIKIMKDLYPANAWMDQKLMRSL